MSSTNRTWTLWASLTAIALFAGAAIASYRPSGESDRTRSLESLKEALHTLDDATLGPAARLEAYRVGLQSVDRLLCGAIRENPVDTASIERLALVRWESETLTASTDATAIASLLDIAATRAPRVPEIQAGVGELFCKMGRPEDGVPFIRRSVELSPAMTNRAVATLQSAGFPPEQIVEALPPESEVLIAVKPLFIESGRGLDYLDQVDRRLVNAKPSLLMAYGEACLQLRVPERLRDRMLALPPTDDLAVRAERVCQAAHAWLSLGIPDRALIEADEARRSAPADPRIVEFYGEVALAAGRGEEAESAFRQSLELVIADGAQPAQRARLYEALGRSLEAQGRTDVAYDSFRRALEVDPSAVSAAKRVAEYEHRGAVQQP